jgi:hypothetical protein
VEIRAPALRFDILMLVTIKIIVVLKEKPFVLLVIYRHFGRTCCPNLPSEYNSIVTDFLKALLGNGSINTFQHATVGAVFYMWSVARQQPAGQWTD